jgi:dATP pyrophosphohydrolase
MSRIHKIPQSVLVVIHTPALDVLLIRRADAGTWQSVTGSKDSPGRAVREQTAIREVAEETGIDAGHGSALHAGLRDWHLENVYDIYPRWLHRYPPGVTRNTEHVFGLQVPAGTPSAQVRASTPHTSGCPGTKPQTLAFRPPMPRRS